MGVGVVIHSSARNSALWRYSAHAFHYVSAVVAFLAAPGLIAQQVAGPVMGARLTAATFKSPSDADRPWVRWNLPAGVTDEELRKELTEIRDAGVAGVEIGQGVYPPIDQLRLILRSANALGLKVSFLDGPVNAPAGFSIADDKARKSLYFARIVLTQGQRYAGQVPIPEKADRRSLLALQAYRCVGTCQDGSTNVLDAASRVDLTSRVRVTHRDGVAGGVSEGEFEWSADAEGTWIVLAIWAAGYLPQPDLLSEEGTAALVSGIQNFFGPVMAEMRANGGDLFFDSHSTSRGDPVDTWTNDMAAEFEKRAGYAVWPYLPLVLRNAASGLRGGSYAFSFDGEMSARVRRDFNQVRTDLWLQKHVQPLQRWANGLGLHVRVQPYGDNIESIDEIQAATVLEKPETETLWYGDVIDNYLPIASANHFTGKTWYSIEGSAVVNGAYAQTFQDQVVHLNRAYAGGVTKLIYHIYPYRNAASAEWPGFSTFPASFGNSWGPRNPHWQDARSVNDYFARTQLLLSQGTAKVDVAVYLQNYLWPQPYTVGGLQHWSDPALPRAGYTRDYVNSSLLESNGARVSDGRLVPAGPAYKALVIDSTQRPEVAPSRDAMPLATARKVLEFAREGLPVVIVGRPPSRTPGLDGPAASLQLAQIFGEIVRLPSTHVVASEADVPVLLAGIGVVPSARPMQPGSLLSVHRHDRDTDIYWFYNGSEVVPADAPATLFEPSRGEAIETQIELDGQGTPYLLNAWDGSIVPVEHYSRAGSTVRLRVRVPANGSVAIAVTTEPRRFGFRQSDVHVAATTADALIIDSGGRVRVSALTPGTYDTSLSDGRGIQSRIGRVQAPLDLTSGGWSLDVVDWQPANRDATGASVSDTAKIPVHLMLGGLRAWPDIPELADTSGTAVYHTTFDLPPDWSPRDGAVLSLGEVCDTFSVVVNKQEIPFPDQLAAEMDVSRFLRAGTNTLDVRVATTLLNRLRTLDPALGDRKRQAYGLIGPVVLHSYATAAEPLYIHGRQ